MELSGLKTIFTNETRRDRRSTRSTDDYSPPMDWVVHVELMEECLDDPLRPFGFGSTSVLSKQCRSYTLPTSSVAVEKSCPLSPSVQSWYCHHTGLLRGYLPGLVGGARCFRSVTLLAVHVGLEQQGENLHMTPDSAGKSGWKYFPTSIPIT